MWTAANIIHSQVHAFGAQKRTPEISQNYCDLTQVTRDLRGAAHDLESDGQAIFGRQLRLFTTQLLRHQTPSFAELRRKPLAYGQVPLVAPQRQAVPCHRGSPPQRSLCRC